jgi:hypothetical protein
MEKGFKHVAFAPQGDAAVQGIITSVKAFMDALDVPYDMNEARRVNLTFTGFDTEEEIVALAADTETLYMVRPRVRLSWPVLAFPELAFPRETTVWDCIFPRQRRRDGRPRRERQPNPLQGPHAFIFFIY